MIFNLTKVTRSIVSSSVANKRTLRRRSDEIVQYRQVASGGGDLAQLHHELKDLNPDQRQQLFMDMEFKIEIPAL